MQRTAAYYKQQLHLEPHIEGGAYRRTYASPLTFRHPAANAERHLSSAIYFLLEYGEFSAFHRLKADEMWHFYAGDALTIYEIKADGTLYSHVLGNNIEKGECFQVIITAGSWFGSRVESGAFALVGCTVTPGFDFLDFELAGREQLKTDFPQHGALIEELTGK